MYSSNSNEEKIFLNDYNPSDFDRPSVATDIVVLTIGDNKRLSLLLVERGEHPYKGSFALIDKIKIFFVSFIGLNLVLKSTFGCIYCLGNALTSTVCPGVLNNIYAFPYVVFSSKLLKQATALSIKSL